MAKRPKKWRVSTKDQAAECFRRFMEQDLSMRDNIGYLEHLKSSLNIIEEAIISGDFDHKTADRLSKIVGDALLGTLLFRDSDIGATLAKFLSRRMHYVRLEKNDLERLNEFRRLFPIPPTLPGIDCPQVVNQEALEEGTEREGLIKVMTQQNYGFITDDTGLDWFFHRTGLVQPSIWPKLVPVQRVKFRIGKNARGPCAVEISPCS
jgi:LuxR family glucitol operon transcriptional activator